MSELKNIIDMRRYYAGTVFGFAAARTNLPAGRLSDVAEFKSFEALEIHHEQLDAMSVFRREQLLERYRVLHTGNLMDLSLCRNLVAAPKPIQDSFIDEAARILKQLKDLYQIKTVTLDLSIGNALGDSGWRAVVARILRKLHPYLLENGQTVLLPFRIPVLSGCDAEQFAAFLRELMIPNVKVRLDIYPHELKKNPDPHTVAANLRFECRSVMFCYDADSGNRLLRAHLAPWLKYFALNAFRGPFFVCPFSQEHRLSPQEAESYSKLVDELKHNKQE